MTRRAGSAWLLPLCLLAGCLHHAFMTVEPPPRNPPPPRQATLALVPLNDQNAPQFSTGFFHEALTAAIRRTEGFQVLDYTGPWPDACRRPFPGTAVDLRLLVADIQRTCPSELVAMYEVTQLKTVRPMRIGLRVVLVRTSDNAALLDYDGVWDGPDGPPDPIPRPGLLRYLLPPVALPHDPLDEISPQRLSERAARDVAGFLGNATLSAAVPVDVMDGATIDANASSDEPPQLPAVAPLSEQQTTVAPDDGSFQPIE